MKKRSSRRRAATSVGSPSFKILSGLVAVVVGVSFFLPALLLHHNPGREGAHKPAGSLSLRLKKKPRARRHRKMVSDHGGAVAGVEEVHDKNDFDCSCMGSHHQRSCCDRRLVRVHKMGYALIAELFGADKSISVSSLPDPVNIQFYENSRNGQDYRYVIVTRNLHDALISGFLYHKAGHECWKNENGGSMAGRRKRYKGWLQTYNWEHHVKDTVGVPPALGRNLCTYLKDESEQVGMRVYVDVALQKWYRNVLVARELALQSSVGGNRTLFVCYEQLASLSTREDTMRKILDWMYPRMVNGTDKDASTGERNVAKKSDIQTSVYSGGHATNHDPELRRRLRKIIQHLDEQLLHGEIASFNAALGCDCS